MAKDLHFAVLLDFYGALLTEKQAEYLDYYYCADLSLAEIAAEATADGISRQAVRDAIKRGEQLLLHYEEKLGFAARHQAYQTKLAEASRLADALAARLPADDGDAAALHSALEGCRALL